LTYFKVGDYVQVINDAYDDTYQPIKKGTILPVVEKLLADEDNGYWISTRGAVCRTLNTNWPWASKNLRPISPAYRDTKEVISPCTRNPETGNLVFGDLSEEPKEEYTGSSVDYYKVKVDNPTTQETPYSAEANDIIEALGLTFAEGNLLKAVWRIAADRKGLKKKGNNSVYDAEKLVFFANRVLVQEKAK
jgi:hypothetical protein